MSKNITQQRDIYDTVENLIKNTPSRSHHIHQRRGLLRNPSNI